MLTNIRYEAAYASRVSHLNFMAHPSPNRGIAKGSYELYDPRSQGKGSDSAGEEMMNGTAGGVAPGSPGSIQDYKQVLSNLQRELEDRKRREQELQQVVNTLRATQSPSTASFVDNQFMNPEVTGSPSNDSVGENVKDAHIKHLQRQVTVLQSNLYKAESWTQRATTAIREKDQALDELARVKSELATVQEEKEGLKRKNDELTQRLAAQQQNHGQGLNTQQRLMDDLRAEIKTLKESLTRLDQENRSLKDSSTQSQSLGSNVACSQELEYLHKVVDTLKNTVLEQRTFLLNMRHPGAVGGLSQPSTKSSTSSATSMTNGGALPRRNSSSPHPRASDAAVAAQAQQPFYGHPAKSSLPTETLPDHRQRPPRNGSAPELGLELGSAAPKYPGRKFNSREMLEEFMGPDLSSSNLARSEEYGSPRSRQEVVSGVKPAPHMKNNNDGYITPVGNSSGTTQKATLVQQASGDNGRQRQSSTNNVSSNGYVPMHMSSTVQRKKSHSEVVLRNVPDQANAEQTHSKTENFGRNPEMFPQEGRNLQQWNLSSAVTTGPQHTAGVGSVVPNVSAFGAGPAAVSSQQPGYLPLSSAMQAQSDMRGTGRVYGGQDVQNTFVWDEKSVQNLLDNNLVATMENLNLNLASSQAQMFQASSDLNNSTVRVINHDMMAGGNMTVPSPSAHRATGQASSAVGQPDLYVNVSGGAREGTGVRDTSSSVDLELTRPRLTSDRLCPVCNRDYSEVSLEDFQTHVFECFDDENAPETMKPQPAPESVRSCPMCNAKFGATTTQSEYEKHVHSHFAEEAPEENFEILQPL